MDLSKIPEERLFQNNSREEIQHWCKNLKYFYYMRAKSGHNCEGDSFSACFRYGDKNDLIEKLGELGVELNKIDEESIAFDPFESYSFEDLDKLKMVIPRFEDLEQPQYVEVAGHKVHIWVHNYRFEISVSGIKDGQVYKVSSGDFDVCLELEDLFDKLGWQQLNDEDITGQYNCISKNNYPELFT